MQHQAQKVHNKNKCVEVSWHSTAASSRPDLSDEATFDLALQLFLCIHRQGDGAACRCKRPSTSGSLSSLLSGSLMYNWLFEQIVAV